MRLLLILIIPITFCFGQNTVDQNLEKQYKTNTGVLSDTNTKQNVKTNESVYSNDLRGESNADLRQDDLNVSAYKNDSITDWIRAIAQLIGIPATIWGLITLFRRDKKQERKLKGLEDIAISQNEINTNFVNQINELKTQTQEFKEHTSLMAQKNSIIEESLNLEKEKHSYLTEKRLEELEEYYCELIKSLLEPIEQQAKNLTDFADNLKEKKIKDYYLKTNSSLHIENIEAINHNDLYKIFVTNRQGNREEKIQNFRILTDSVNLIKRLKVTIPEEFKTFIKKFDKFQDLWNGNADGIGRLYDEYVTINESKNIHPNRDSFLNEFGKIIGNWHSLGSSPKTENIHDPYFVLEKLILPLKQLCLRVQDQRVLQILPLITECEYAIANLDNLKNIYGDLATTNSEELLKTKDRLNESIKNLSKIEKV